MNREALLTGMLLVLMMFQPADCQNLEIHHIDVGQGDATLVVGPDGTTVLIDAGAEGVGESVVAPYLLALGVTKVDFIIATHMHADHIGGLDEVLTSGIRIGRVLDNGSIADSAAYRDYENAVFGVQDERAAFAPGDVLALGQGARLLCVYANGRSTSGELSVSDENDRSVAVVIEFDNFDYFIGGDIGGGGKGQKDVESFIAPLVSDLDVLRVNHHGSATSTNSKFVRITKPELAIISVGDNNYGHPSSDVIQRLLGVHADVMQTGAGDHPSGKVCGNIVVVAKKGKKYWVNGNARCKDEFIPKSDRPPVAGFIYQTSGQTVRFDAFTSSDEGRIRRYFWNLGDGTTIEGKKYETLSHAYAEGGSYLVFLCVQDKYGITGAAEKRIDVDEAGGIIVTAGADPSDPKQNSTVRINVSVVGGAAGPLPNAQVRAVAHYKTTDTAKEGTTGPDGRCALDFQIGNATIGYKVVVDVAATFGGVSSTASTYFIPRDDGGGSASISVSATASPSNPSQYSHVKITATVVDQNDSPVSGAYIATVAHYKTTDTAKSGWTGSDGRCVIDYYISGATKGYTVWVDVTATYQGKSASTRTAFTPW